MLKSHKTSTPRGMTASRVAYDEVPYSDHLKVKKNNMIIDARKSTSPKHVMLSGGRMDGRKLYHELLTVFKYVKFHADSFSGDFLPEVDRTTIFLFTADNQLCAVKKIRTGKVQWLTSHLIAVELSHGQSYLKYTKNCLTLLGENSRAINVIMHLGECSDGDYVSTSE